jgi:hypothetical protein
MAKFEQSRPDHEVHEIHMPQGHGYMDQKHQKGMRSPIVGSVPTVDNGTQTSGPAGSPGQPNGEYAAGSQTGN